MSAAGHPPRFRNVVLLVSTFLLLMANGGLFLLVVALKQIATEFDWPRSVPSFAYSLQFIGAGIGGILMAHWADRRGAAPVALLGACMMGAGAVLTSMIDAEWQLYVIYAVMMGFFGQATVVAPLMANVMRWFEDRRGFAVGVVSAGQSVAGVIWPPIFRHFNETAGWQFTFFWFGLFAIVTSAPLALLLRRRPPTPVPQPAGSTAESPETILARSKASIGLSSFALHAALCAAIVGCCVAMSMPLAHLVAHTSDVGHVTARGAEMLSVLLTATLIVRLLGGTLVLDRFGGLIALLVFSSVQALALSLYAFVDGLVAMYLVSVLFGLGYGGIAMCYPVIVREYLPASNAGRNLAIVNLFGALGMALGGWVAGFVFDARGAYAAAFLIGVAFNLMNLTIVLALLSRRRRLRLTPMEAKSAAA